MKWFLFPPKKRRKNLEKRKMLEFLKKKIHQTGVWVESWAETPHALFALFVLAFIESSFFPIPPDVLLIVLLVMNNKTKWWKYALICSFGSVLGGLFGYFIGYGFYEAVGKKIVEFYNLGGLMAEMGAKYEQYSFWVVFTAAFTPIPYKAITVSAGFFKINLFGFIIASAVGRAARFFILAYFLKLFGPQVKRAIYKYFNILSVIFIILLIGGFMALKFIF